MTFAARQVIVHIQKKQQRYKIYFIITNPLLGLIPIESKQMQQPLLFTPLKKINPSISVDMKGFLWSHLGSNQGPPDYESGALTS